VAIAHRAALRVLPVWGEAVDHRWSRNADLTALPILRCLMTSGVPRIYPTSEVQDAARAAAAARTAVFSTPLSPPFPHLPPPLPQPQPTQPPPQFGNKSKTKSRHSSVAMTHLHFLYGKVTHQTG